MDICKDISVVIQGPLDNRTYEAIDQYQYFNEVIVSTWNTDDISLLNQAVGKYKLVTSNYPQNIASYYNGGSRYFMAQTTFAGASIASGKYVMKTRSDELYPDLSAMLSNLEKYPDRVHTTDNGFWTNIKGAFSNHLFIDKTNHIVDAMSKHIAYSSKQDPQKSSYLNSIFMCAEQSFGYFLMLARGYDLLETNVNTVYKNNMFITPCYMLNGHLHSGQTSKDKARGFKRSSDPYPNGRKDVHNGRHDVRHLCQNIEDLQ